MVGDIAIVAEQEFSFVGGFTTAFADGAIKTTPALVEDHFRKLEEPARAIGQTFISENEPF